MAFDPREESGRAFAIGCPAAILILLIFALEIALSRLAVQAAEPTQPFQPPWEHSRMRDIAGGSRVQKTPLPPEVEEKRNEAPVSWCSRDHGYEHSHGYVRTLFVTEFAYADGTKVRYRYHEYRPYFAGASQIERRTDYWEVVNPSGAKTRYHPSSNVSESTRQQLQLLGVEPSGPYKIVWPEAGRDAVRLGKWDVDLKQFQEPSPSSAPAGTPSPSQQPAPSPQPSQTPSPTPAPAQDKGSFFSPSFSKRLATVAYKSRPEASPGLRTVEVPAPLSLAGTTESAPTPQLQTQTRAEPEVINIKIVTYGDPPAEVFIHLDPGPQSTPEQIVTGTPVTTWTPEDREGPKTHTGTPGGIPIIFYPPGTPITGGPPGQPVTTGEPAGQPPVTTGTGGPPGKPPVTGTPIIGIPITPGTTIHVGWGWAHSSVESSRIASCLDQTGEGRRASGQPAFGSVSESKPRETMLRNSPL